MSDNYTRLDNAVKDLLSELRIDETSLELMAKGKSPDYPGVITKKDWQNPHCKVQLSATVAKKLIDAGVGDTDSVVINDSEKAVIGKVEV